MAGQQAENADSRSLWFNSPDDAKAAGCPEDSPCPDWLSCSSCLLRNLSGGRQSPVAITGD